MAERFYLGMEPGVEETLHFTLVVESPADFYVEVYNDSPRSFATERTKIVRKNDFKGYKIQGVALHMIVAEKFYETNFLAPEKKPRKYGSPQKVLSS